jgi:hypothetical protein
MCPRCAQVIGRAGGRSKKAARRQAAIEGLRALSVAVPAEEAPEAGGEAGKAGVGQVRAGWRARLLWCLNGLNVGLLSTRAVAVRVEVFGKQACRASHSLPCPAPPPRGPPPQQAARAAAGEAARPDVAMAEAGGGEGGGEEEARAAPGPRANPAFAGSALLRVAPQRPIGPEPAPPTPLQRLEVRLRELGVGESSVHVEEDVRFAATRE